MRFLAPPSPNEELKAAMYEWESYNAQSAERHMRTTGSLSETLGAGAVPDIAARLERSHETIQGVAVCMNQAAPQR
jgi:hypothetical protein